MHYPADACGADVMADTVQLTNAERAARRESVRLEVKEANDRRIQQWMLEREQALKQEKEEVPGGRADHREDEDGDGAVDGEAKTKG